MAAQGTLTAQTPLTPKRPNKWASYFKRSWPLYAMLIPMIVYQLIFSYYPMLGVVIAFKDWRILGGIWGSPWASTNGSLDLFKHFKTLFGDPDFVGKLINTLRISGLRILFGFPVPILMTILLNEMGSRRFSKGFQVVSYLPHFISWVVIAGILTSLTSSQSAFQEAMKSIFGKELPFFTDDNFFLGIVIVSDIWKEAGWATIIYFAAVASISKELYEAASIDGASRFQKICSITLPGMVPAISVNLILTASNIIYGGFDQIYNLYNDTVLGKGDIIETYLFRIGIQEGQYDLAAAMGLFNSVISLVLVLIANKLIKLIGGDSIW